MRLRHALRVRPLLAVLAATLVVVALAYGGEDEPPTATTAPTAPTATAEPEATEVTEPTATLRPGQPTATTGPTAMEVPQEELDYRDNWTEFLLSHRGYKAEWGEPQSGGIYKTAEPRPASRFQTTLGYGAFSRWQFTAHNSVMMMDPWGEITDAPICDLCESFEVSADGLTYTFVLRDNVQFHDEG